MWHEQETIILFTLSYQILRYLCLIIIFILSRFGRNLYISVFLFFLSVCTQFFFFSNTKFFSKQNSFVRVSTPEISWDSAGTSLSHHVYVTSSCNPSFLVYKYLYMLEGVKLDLAPCAQAAKRAWPFFVLTRVIAPLTSRSQIYNCTHNLTL